MPEAGAQALCKHCSEPIEFIIDGRHAYWRHTQTRPRHPGEPADIPFAVWQTLPEELRACLLAGVPLAWSSSTYLNRLHIAAKSTVSVHFVRERHRIKSVSFTKGNSPTH